MSTSTVPQSESQYSLVKILGIWVAAALPMAILGWIVAPALAPDFTSNPIVAGATRVGLLSVGLIWQFVLAMIIIYREEGNLRWATIRRRGRLNTPRDPKTGEPRHRMLLWLIPISILFVALTFFVFPMLDRLWVGALPFLAEPPSFAFGALLESPEIQAQLVGAWWFVGLFLIMGVFNTFLGEEFLFRGVLLPKMNGRFGKWDWVANGVLFGAYHWHQPWMILSGIIMGVSLFALPAKLFRSTWMAIITHSIQTVFFLFLMLGVVLGLA
ncbi:lysostaphin resistance A-like protein [Chloroflexota bacterium]